MQAEESEMEEKLKGLQDEVHAADLELKRLFLYLFGFSYLCFTLKKFHFLIFLYCSSLKEEQDTLRNSMNRQNDEMRKIDDKVSFDF